MDPRSLALIEQLSLEPHPEGGFYSQSFKSPHRTTLDDGRGSRSALTAIYFLLPHGHFSRWHRVASDEVWTFLEGSPVTLHVLEEGTPRRIAIGPLAAGATPFHVVPGHQWQAAEAESGYALVACFVAPGFEFADFELMSDSPEAQHLLAAAEASLIRLV